MRKILVLRGGALGDFIVTLPAIALLRQRWPEARIELAGNAAAAELARARGLLDAVHSQHEARWSGLYGEAPLRAEFGDWLGGFDLVVNYWPDPEGTVRAKLPVRADQLFVHAEAHSSRAPAAAHYCEPLRQFELETRNFFFALKPLAPARRATGRSISIHPGSGSAGKNWPIERWVELCGWLERELRAQLLIVSGEADAVAADALAAFGRPARNLPLEDLVTHFSQCRLFLGHDSGISHLAAACGAPSILLFGPTDPARWAPPAPQVRVLRRGAEVSAIGLADLQLAVTTALADQR